MSVLRDREMCTFRDATITRETRDALDKLRDYLHDTDAPSEFVDAVIDVTDRWDANEATEVEA